MRNTPVLFFVAVMLSFSFLSSCTRTKTGDQESSADIYRSFQVKKDVRYFSIPPRLASVFIDDSQVGSEELRAILRELNHMSLLVIPTPASISENSPYQEINERLDAINFKDLITISSGQDEVRVKTHQPNQTIEEMVVLVASPETLFCVSFIGNISAETLNELAKPQNLGVISSLKQFTRRL